MEIRAQVHIGTLPTQLLFSVIRLIIHFVLDETCVGVILMIKKDKKKKKKQTKYLIQNSLNVFESERLHIDG